MTLELEIDVPESRQVTLSDDKEADVVTTTWFYNRYNFHQERRG